MVDAPRISVIMPARNARTTIAAALESVLAQSVPDWEVVVVDDGSTDTTGAVIANMMRDEPRIRLVQGIGEGASGARNRGIHSARGRYLAFLDADDWIAPEFMATMLDALEDSAAHEIAYCAFRRAMPDGRMTSGFADPRVEREPFEIFARTCAVVTINCLVIDRQLVLDAGGFDTSLLTCEDWDLWQRLSRAGARWLMVDQPMSFYRSSDGSLTRNSRQMLADGKTVIKRAFGPDPRVARPLPEYAQGLQVANGLSADEAFAWFAFWNIVVATVQGQDALPDLNELRFLSHGPDRAEAIADNIIEALSVTLRVVPQQLAAIWPCYEAGLDRLLGRLGRLWQDPVAERRVRYALDRKLLAYDDLAEPRQLSLTTGLRVRIDAPPVTSMHQGQDRLYAYIDWDTQTRAILEIGALGDYGQFEWVDQIFFPKPSRKAIGPFIGALGRPAPVAALLQAHGLKPERKSISRRLRERLDIIRGTAPSAFQTSIAEGEALILRQQHIYAPGSHNLALARLANHARAQALALPPARFKDTGQRQTPRESDRGGDRRQFWDSYFSNTDPWNYGSSYEQEKYRLQLDCVPSGPIGNALELACAEGMFTVQLAERVDHLLATDIAKPAIDRARQRLSGRENVEFALLDLSKESLPCNLDLIICSEVLYYLDDREELASVTARLAAALAPGGAIVTAHAYLAVDDPGSTGFDWANPFGARVISRAFAQTPGLVLERSVRTELYQVDRYRKCAAPSRLPEPEISHVKMTAQLEPAVARHVIWDRTIMSRGEAAAQRRTSLPSLMYHSVSDDGPVALRRYRLPRDMFQKQVRWLRSNGYHAITTHEIAWHLSNNVPFSGRPVWISFDDGLQDFADNAWPELRAADLTAEVFLVTDHVGGGAVWDAGYGPAAPLMNHDTIARLAQDGVHFGSHLATHRAADGLSTQVLAEEMLRSRAMIERWIGWTPNALCAPYGATDGRFGRLAEQCGYGVAIGGGTGPVRLGDAMFDLRRMEVRGDGSFEGFTGMMEALL
ncbi:glycosyltransferase [Sphingobium limneticum]|uniref:glycosyltransferase n=1 Tax=Sphingobium limneticum TaxID=1007511 RepID=UPI001478310A|nr:glycosyltransferase [Sphingobium limneticum]